MPESLKTKVLKDFTPVTEINQATLPTNNDYNFTDNLGLIQPGQNNYYDIRESCFNMEILDRIINNMLTEGYSKEEIDAFLAQFGTDLNNHKLAKVTDTIGAHGLVYEEGIWTPTLAGLTVAGNNTYSVRSANYVRVNSLVSISCRILLTAKDAAMAGAIVINGLPFVHKSTSESSVMQTIYGNINYTNTKKPVALVPGASARIELTLHESNLGTTAVTASEILNSSAIHVTGTYRI